MAAFDAQQAALSLIGGMEPATFDADIREQCPMHFPAALGSVQAADLFGIDQLQALLRKESMPLSQVDLYQDGHLVRLADMQKKSGRTGLSIVAERFRAGATVRVRDIDALDERLGAFSAAVRHQFAAPAQINLYLTPRGQDGFPPHFDITDGFVVQCLGAKQWRLYADYTHRVELPPMATNWDPERFTPLVEPESKTLEAGDVLYVPRGAMHEARCIDRASLHLTVAIEPMTWADLVRRAVEHAATTDLMWRRRVPWSADGCADEERRITEGMRERLLALADALDVQPILASERAALRGEASTHEDAASGEPPQQLFQGFDR